MGAYFIRKWGAPSPYLPSTPRARRLAGCGASTLSVRHRIHEAQHLAVGRPRRGGAGPANEIFAARKDWGGGIRVALVYPNRYAAGMSNLGFLLIYARINARQAALCERGFLSGQGGRVCPPR